MFIHSFYTVQRLLLYIISDQSPEFMFVHKVRISDKLTQDIFVFVLCILGRIVLL